MGSDALGRWLGSWARLGQLVVCLRPGAEPASVGTSGASPGSGAGLHGAPVLLSALSSPGWVLRVPANVLRVVGLRCAGCPRAGRAGFVLQLIPFLSPPGLSLRSG